MNWGILGCATIAERSFIPAILSTPNNNLIAIASRDLSKAQNLANKFQCIAIQGYDNLLENELINAVYIPLPTGMHFTWIIKALNAKKHVLVEKSAISTYEEAVLVTRLAQTNSLALVENFQFLHHSQHQFVKNLVYNNEIGEIRTFKSSFGFPPFSQDNNIRYIKELGGGSLLDAGAYVLRASSFMLEDELEISASYLNFNKLHKVDWYGGAFLVCKNKNIFSQVSFGFDNYYQCNYEIWGSSGKITVDRAFTANNNFNPTLTIEKNGSKKEVKLETDDHFKKMILYFNKIVEAKKFDEEREKILAQAKLIDDFKKNIK
jgi:predicted dehydrogenase